LQLNKDKGMQVQQLAKVRTQTAGQTLHSHEWHTTKVYLRLCGGCSCTRDSKPGLPHANPSLAVQRTGWRLRRGNQRMLASHNWTAVHGCSCWHSGTAVGTAEPQPLRAAGSNT
jgi:hypothetical protein